MNATLRTWRVARVSPLRACVWMARLGPARALSYDGVNWQLEVRVATPRRGWGVLDAATAAPAWVLIGVWARAEGYAAFPLGPRFDRAALEADAAPLRAALETFEPGSPAATFPLLAGRELWLTDGEGEALVLLQHAEPGGGADGDRDRDRDPGVPASARYWRAVDPTAHDRLAYADAARLERWVNQWPGRRFVWRERGVDPLPALPFADSDALAPLKSALAPELLTWDLPDAVRAQLEPLAWRHAARVETLYRLFPRVLDHAGLRAARVEASLRRRNPDAGRDPEPA